MSKLTATYTPGMRVLCRDAEWLVTRVESSSHDNTEHAVHCIGADDLVRGHWTSDELRREGFPEDILQALDCVTERKGESYDAFLTRAASNPIARRVKLADLEDNMNVRDLPEVTPKDAQRLSTYIMAWHRLSES